MMLGKPVIVAADTNMDRMIDRAKCGCVVHYGDTAELENAIKYLADNPSLANELGENGRLAYESTYDWNIMQLRLLDLYKKVLVK